MGRGVSEGKSVDVLEGAGVSVKESVGVAGGVSVGAGGVDDSVAVNVPVADCVPVATDGGVRLQAVRTHSNRVEKASFRLIGKVHIPSKRVN